MTDNLPCTQHAERLASIEHSIEDGGKQFDIINAKLDKIYKILGGNGDAGLCEIVRGHDKVIRRINGVLIFVSTTLAAGVLNWIWGIFRP